MKDKALACLKAFEDVFYRPLTFRVVSWLAVALAIASIFLGGRLAVTSCALSLGVIAHMLMALLTNVNGLASSFEKIGRLYSKEIQSTEKKNTPETQPQPAKVH